jgi:hypothetical protein
MARDANSLLFPNLYDTDNEMLPPTAREIQISANFAVLKVAVEDHQRTKRCASTHDTTEQGRKRLALETAVLVHQEVEQWEKSIREIEFLLQQQQQQQHHSVASMDNKSDADPVADDAVAAPFHAAIPVVLDDEEEVNIPSLAFTSSNTIDNIHSQ